LGGWWGLSHSTSPFFFFLRKGFFQDRISWTISPGWLQTMTVLIFASWVAIGSRQHLSFEQIGHGVVNKILSFQHSKNRWQTVLWCCLESIILTNIVHDLYCRYELINFCFSFCGK
jgi:hypothetical protein